jgi:hypothetical protein
MCVRAFVGFFYLSLSFCLPVCLPVYLPIYIYVVYSVDGWMDLKAVLQDYLQQSTRLVETNFKVAVRSL